MHSTIFNQLQTVMISIRFAAETADMEIFIFVCFSTTWMIHCTLVYKSCQTSRQFENPSIKKLFCQFCSLAIQELIFIVLSWMKEGKVLFKDSLNTFYLRLCGIRHMVKDHSYSERGNLLSPHGFLISSRQDNNYHGLCYTSRGALASMRNSSMGAPWGIDPTILCSYHRATLWMNFIKYKVWHHLNKLIMTSVKKDKKRVNWKVEGIYVIM